MSPSDSSAPLDDSSVTLRGLVVGQRVFGRFTLQRLLGRGGMGVVWLARDERLERNVALKFLPELLALDERALVDLKHETRRSLELTHPHIVRIHDLYEDGRTAAIAMEYVDGPSLARRAVDRPGGAFEPADVMNWVNELCAALDYAHGDVKVVHRDLKPANLLTNARGHLKVADFGISASVSETVTRVSRVASSSGTPVYMSPQQMLGSAPSPTDDIYAVGATLYELLTGRPPFFRGDIAQQVINIAAPTLAARRTELGIAGEPLPAVWEDTIAACLAKDPSRRPQHAGEIAARLSGRTTTMSVTLPAGGLPTVDAPTVVATGASAVRAPGASSAATDPKPPAHKSRAGLWLGVLVLLAAAGIGGYYYAVHLPEQNRIELERQRLAAQTEQARVEAERLRLEAARAEAARIERDRREAAEKAEREREEAAARAQREKEDADQSAILDRIETAADGAPRAILDATEAAVRTYLAAAPERHRESTLAAWLQRKQSWEVARVASARGGIIVRTVPPGAEVRVGAIAAEESPLTLKEQKLGRYPVRVRLAGYEDWAGEIEVQENEFAELEVPLVRSVGRLIVTTEPAGLAYRIEGEGRTESGTAGGRALELPTGGYTLTVSRPKFGDERRTLEIRRNEATTESVAILGGGIELISNPPGAEVMQSGRVIGRTPYRVEDAPPGEYRFDVRNKGYKSASATVKVVARALTREVVALEKVPDPDDGRPWTVPALGLEMAWIQPGSFTLGSPTWEVGRFDDEGPQTRVTLTRGFWLGKCEVTQAQWQSLMGNNPSHFLNAGPKAPVEMVSWNEVMDFCRRLTERERAAGRLPVDHVYTLPTEVQWEYACRAGSTSALYSGPLNILGVNTARELDPIGWYGGNSGVSYEGGFDSSNWPEKQYVHTRAGTHPVGLKRANAWGLYDMIGNVFEWTRSWYGNYPGGTIIDYTGSSTGDALVCRGGGWGDVARGCRSALRFKLKPDERLTGLGFRVALAPDR